MKRKVFIFIIIMSALLVFAVAGIPTLRYVKSNVTDLKENPNIINDTSDEVDNTRLIDLSVETICKDPVTGEIELRCETRDGCDALCRMRGCNEFGMDYVSTDFSEQKCQCICRQKSFLERSLK